MWRIHRGPVNSPHKWPVTRKCFIWWRHHVNTLKPRQNGHHLAVDIFRCMFVNEEICILIKTSLKFVPRAPINNISALAQIMAWRRPGGKPSSEPIVVNLLTRICVTQLQWVKWTHRQWSNLCRIRVKYQPVSNLPQQTVCMHASELPYSHWLYICQVPLRIAWIAEVLWQKCCSIIQVPLTVLSPYLRCRWQILIKILWLLFWGLSVLWQ